MSTGDILGIINFAFTLTIIWAYLTEQRRAERAEAVAEMWKRLALKRTDRIAVGLED